MGTTGLVDAARRAPGAVRVALPVSFTTALSISGIEFGRLTASVISCNASERLDQVTTRWWQRNREGGLRLPLYGCVGVQRAASGSPTLRAPGDSHPRDASSRP